jgi:hypothetical protein
MTSTRRPDRRSTQIRLIPRRLLSWSSATVCPTRGDAGRNEAEGLDQLADGLPLLRSRAFGVVAGRQQAMADEQHVAGADDEDRQPDRCELEEPERLETLVLQRVGGDEVGGRGDQRHHPAGQGSDRERHHQAGAGHSRLRRDRQGDRDEDGDDPGRADERPGNAHGQHEQGDEAGLAGAAEPHQPLADRESDPGGDERLAHDEESGDHDDHGIREPGEGLGHADDAAQQESEQNEQRDHVQAGPTAGEQHHGDSEHTEHERHVTGHRSSWSRSRTRCLSVR